MAMRCRRPKPPDPPTKQLNILFVNVNEEESPDDDVNELYFLVCAISPALPLGSSQAATVAEPDTDVSSFCSNVQRRTNVSHSKR